MAVWRLTIAVFYYPLIIAAALYIWLKDLHWGWALCLLVLVAWQDPLIRILLDRVKKRSRSK